METKVRRKFRFGEKFVINLFNNVREQLKISQQWRTNKGSGADAIS